MQGGDYIDRDIVQFHGEIYHSFRGDAHLHSLLFPEQASLTGSKDILHYLSFPICFYSELSPAQLRMHSSLVSADSSFPTFPSLPFNKCLLIYYVPGIVLSVRDMVVNKTEKVCVFVELYSHGEKGTSDKQIYIDR